MKSYRYAAVALVLAAAPRVLFGADEDIESLKKQIQALDQKVRILERKAELEREGGEVRNKDAPRLSAGADGFSFSSADTNFVLRLRGNVQADARFYVDDRIPANDTFLLRRVRPVFEGTVFKYYDYRIMLDFASGTSISSANDGFLWDAYLNVRYWPEFQIQVGKFKPPIGLERLQSDINLLFMERGLPTQLVPNRDVGVQLHGELLGGSLNYAAGVFNGVQDNGSGDSDVGTDDHKDVAARLFAQPFKTTRIASLQGLGIGLAGSWGNQGGTLPSFKTPGQQTFFSYVTGTGTNANVTADGEHWRLAPQAYYYWGPFGVFGEYVISSQKLRRDAGGSVPIFDTAQNRAWQVAGSWFVTGEHNSFNPVKPARPFSPTEGGWGALELAARYGELTLDPELFSPVATSGVPFASASSARKVRSWGVGANWYLNRNIKLSLDYDQTDFDGGSAKPGNVTAQDERVIMTRVQFSF